MKPWDDETDMKEMENEVRKIETDGLLWGACEFLYLSLDVSYTYTDNVFNMYFFP